MIQPIGYLKLHRELASKTIWANSNSKQRNVLITVLMMAWFKESEWDWKGEKFKTYPGQFVTSLESIAKECGNDVSVQNVRTALTKFESLGFLTNKSTNKNRLITITNWVLYQQDKDLTNKQNSRQSTINQQATNNQLTTKEESKESKKEKNDIIVAEKTDFDVALEEFEKMRNKIKKPMTDKAKVMLVSKLDKLSSDKTMQIAILEKSILNNWSDVYQLKPEDIPFVEPITPVQQEEYIPTTYPMHELFKKMAGED